MNRFLLGMTKQLLLELLERLLHCSKCILGISRHDLVGSAYSIPEQQLTLI